MRMNRSRSKGRLALSIAVMLVCGSVFLIFVLRDGRRLAFGPCISRRKGVAKGVCGEAKELLKTSNFEASNKAIRDLEAGFVDPRHVAALPAFTEEHRICLDTFKEGHRFLPGVADSPLVPAGYGDAGVLFSQYTRSGSKVPHGAKRVNPQEAGSVIGLEARLHRYFSRAVTLVQPGQTLEGFK
jgi:hypothetical protein